MIGAIIGDTVGSVYEFHNIKTKDFPLISPKSELTDDSIMTFAILDCLENNIVDDTEIAKVYKKWGLAFPNSGYGGMFSSWLVSNSLEPYNSLGNGSAMRTSPVGWYANSEDEVIELATKFSSITHNHPLGIKGAVVVSMCIYYARIGKSKEFIKDYIYKEYPRTKTLDYDELVKYYYHGNETCEESVPEALYCFLISNSFIDCLRTTISIGGDSDTLASISCSIAEAYYKKIDKDLMKKVFDKIPAPRLGCETFDLLDKFILKKTLESVSVEEIKDNSIVLIKEENNTATLYHSIDINPLKEYIIYFELINNIKKKYKDINLNALNDYDITYLTNELDKLGKKEVIEIIKKIDGSESYKELDDALNNFNNLFTGVAKFKLYHSPIEALSYIKNNYHEYDDLIEEAMNKTYYK